MGDNRLEPVVLSEDERRTLENWVRRRSTAQGLALRARIVLACAAGGSNVAVAARLGVNYKTVSRWRSRFLRKRLDGLTDDPRPGVPRTITDAQVEDVVVRTLEEVPEGATHWSKRELARQAGISPSSVQRIWRAFGLQPWRTETFKVSPDPLLIDKIRDVVGLYLAPPANAVVFSVDEKPQIQALERTAPVLPMLPGVPERHSFDYERHGTTDLFAALNIATGKVISRLSAQHTAVDFRDFLDQIDQAVEPGLEVHVICDNVADEASVMAALDAIEEAHGGLRAAVHCAGRGGDRVRILDKNGNPGSLDTFAEVVRVNLVGTYNVLRLAAARIARSEPVDGERGAIVLTASVAAFDGQIGQTSYTAAKAGVHGITLVAARDLASRQIRVNTIAPGVFDTPMLARLRPDIREALEQSVPHPSRLGAPDDYGRMAVSLLENSYVNGETIRLDGAIRMPPR